MSHPIVEQHIDNKLRFYYFRNYRWILHSLYWIFVYARGQQIVREDIFSFNGFFLNFLFDNWVIIIFYYVYALYLVPKLFKQNKYKKFFGYFFAILLILPAINVAFQIIFEPYLPNLYQDHHYTWSKFFSETFYYYTVYLRNFVLFASFLFLMETAENISNYKYVEAANEDMKKTQKQLLKTQVDPVFVMNALDNIQNLAITNNPATAHTIVAFSDVLRYRLYKSNSEKVQLSDELLQVKNTFELYNAAYDKQYILEVEGDTNNLQIYPMSILGMIALILDTSEKNNEDSLVLYLLTFENGIDLAIEWEHPIQNKQTITNNIYRFLKEFYNDKCNIEFEQNAALCSIRVHIDV